MIPTLHTSYKSTIINSYIISRCIYVYDMCVYSSTQLRMYIYIFMCICSHTRFVCTFTLNMKPVSRSKLADLRVFREWPRSAQSIVRVSVMLFSHVFFWKWVMFCSWKPKKTHPYVWTCVFAKKYRVLNPIYNLWVDWGMLSTNPWKWKIKPRLSIYHLYINVE